MKLVISLILYISAAIFFSPFIHTSVKPNQNIHELGKTFFYTIAFSTSIFLLGIALLTRLKKNWKKDLGIWLFTVGIIGFSATIGTITTFIGQYSVSQLPYISAYVRDSLPFLLTIGIDLICMGSGILLIIKNKNN
jgi:hypothetical protein